MRSSVRWKVRSVGTAWAGSRKPWAASAMRRAWARDRAACLRSSVIDQVDQGASISFSRTAYMTASIRECSWSFSKMLRTWFLTVFSLM